MEELLLCVNEIQEHQVLMVIPVFLLFAVDEMRPEIPLSLAYDVGEAL